MRLPNSRRLYTARCGIRGLNGHRENAQHFNGDSYRKLPNRMNSENFFITNFSHFRTKILKIILRVNFEINRLISFFSKFALNKIIGIFQSKLKLLFAEKVMKIIFRVNFGKFQPIQPYDDFQD